MSLAPSSGSAATSAHRPASGTSAVLDATVAAAASGSGGGYGSGSGSSTPPPPVISGGWGGGGWVTQNNDPSKEIYPNGIPVGAVEVDSAISPNPIRWQIDPASIQWSGGTYKSYFSDPASTTVNQNPGLKSVQVGEITAADQTKGTYTVIADPDTQNLVVTLKCAYYLNPGNPAFGDTVRVTTTLSAQVVKPTTATLTGTPGTMAFSISVDGTNAIIALDPDAPETLTATTQTSQNFGGDFMITQFFSPTNNQPTVIQSYVDAAGTNHSISTVGNGLNLDDGGATSTTPVGGTLEGGGMPGGQPNGWPMDPNTGPTTNTQIDIPYIRQAVNSLSLSYSGSFKSYLMYQPGAGVWVALAENDWSFNWTVENNPWPAPGQYEQAPQNAQSTPTGANAFPSWTGDVAMRPFS